MSRPPRLATDLRGLREVCVIQIDLDGNAVKLDVDAVDLDGYGVKLDGIAVDLDAARAKFTWTKSSFTR